MSVWRSGRDACCWLAWVQALTPLSKPLAEVCGACSLISGNRCNCSQPPRAAGGVWSALQVWAQQCLALVAQPRAPGRCMNSTAVGKIHTEAFARAFAPWNFVPETGNSCSSGKGGSLLFTAEVRGGPKQGSLYLILFTDVNRKFTPPSPHFLQHQSCWVQRGGEGWLPSVHTGSFSMC